MSEKSKGQNDRAWEALFEKYDILSRIRQEGKFMISAAQGIPGTAAYGQIRSPDQSAADFF